MKEILAELNREDLTAEQKQSLNDELEGIYYKEPEKRIGFDEVQGKADR